MGRRRSSKNQDFTMDEDEAVVKEVDLDDVEGEVVDNSEEEEEEEEEDEEEETKAGPGRGAWGRKLEFFVTCISYAIGMGNIWRFPYLCHKHGGGCFLIPYFVMLVFVAIPIFLLELAFGQFASLGTITIWTISPLFKGVGYAMTYVSWVISVYYTTIIATALLYLFTSFRATMLWEGCDHPWNNRNTCTPLGVVREDISPNATTLPSAEYYFNYILQKSDGFEDFGTPVPYMTLCLLLSWIIICLCVIKGVKSLGKVSYVTAIFPFIMLFVLIIRTAILPGSLEGVKYYVTPKWAKFKTEVLTDAATQIIFSLGCCNGSIITLSSYNKFKNNCYRDAITVATINSITSLLAGFVVFSTLGYMAYEQGVDIEDVVEGGPGLVFIVYPEVLSKLPLPAIWSVFFFLMLIMIGLGSVFAYVETVTTSIQDEMNKFNFLTSKTSRIIFRTLLCSFNFLVGLPLVCRAGIHLFNLLELSVCGWSMLFICLTEMVVVCYVYGIKQFSRDVGLMTGSPLNWYWKICWLVLSPLTLAGLIIFSLVQSKPFASAEDPNHVYPLGIQILGHLIEVVPVALIAGTFVFVYCKNGGWIIMRELSKPASKWGPAEEENRLRFLQEICERRNIDIQDVSDLQPNEVDIEDGGSAGTPASLSASCLVLSDLVKNDGFYQSKLNVAEKIVEEHVKDLNKQGIPTDQLGENEQRIVNLVMQSGSLETIGNPQEDEAESRKMGLSGLIESIRSKIGSRTNLRKGEDQQ